MSYQGTNNMNIDELIKKLPVSQAVAISIKAYPVLRDSLLAAGEDLDKFDTLFGAQGFSKSCGNLEEVNSS